MEQTMYLLVFYPWIFVESSSFKQYYLDSTKVKMKHELLFFERIQ